MKNGNLAAAKKSKNDEFYTRIEDIGKELVHYADMFRDKVVYCNCDDPERSNFWKYFDEHFDAFGLKCLVSTHYVIDGATYKLEICRDGSTGMKSLPSRMYLQGDGDFCSPECMHILRSCDIVVTNPPFSLFREYVTTLTSCGKMFLVMGNQNAITYKEIFPLIQHNEMWLGCNAGDMAFMVPDDSEPRATRYWQDETGQKWRSFGNICWFTNLEHRKRHLPLDLVWDYYGNEDKYPKYDGYDAINVDRVSDIPRDYAGLMGVPITFLGKYCPEQFEIVGVFNHGKDGPWDFAPCNVNGVKKYKRLAIRRRVRQRA